MQRVLVTADLPSWDLQLRSDPPSYALGATTNYSYLLLLLGRSFNRYLCAPRHVAAAHHCSFPRCGGRLVSVLRGPPAAGGEKQPLKEGNFTKSIVYTVLRPVEVTLPFVKELDAERVKQTLQERTVIVGH